jgi:hypothetical protein
VQSQRIPKPMCLRNRLSCLPFQAAYAATMPSEAPERRQTSDRGRPPK